MFSVNCLKLFTLLLWCGLCTGLRILAVFPNPLKSQNILGNGMVRHLLEAGHEVTYITAFLLDNPHPKLEQVHCEVKKAEFLSQNNININTHLRKQFNLNDENFLLSFTINVANATLYDRNVQNLLQDTTQRFDGIIVQWLFHEIYSGFAAVYDCPYIWLNPYEPNAMTLSLIDEQTNSAYTPQMVSDNVPPFTFVQRVQELYGQTLSTLRKKFTFVPQETEVYKKVFSHPVAKRGRVLPPYEVMRHNASLMFGCSHVSLGNAIRLSQNFKDVGGFHIDENVKPLPKDLQKIMDESRSGVIYFSLGTNLYSKDLDPVMKDNLIQVFGGLKQTVIWKFEKDFPNLPKNVHVIKWAPQQSILAHPNSVLFITHGGLLSSTEAVHFGVPIIGIPVFIDQYNNVDRAVRNGYAKRIDLTFNLADDLRIAIEDVLSDPSYKRNMQELHTRYHDRLVPPGAELVHWVEHVYRTQGAPHLRSPALWVPLYQKLYLDLLLVMVILGIVLWKLLVFLIGSRVLSLKIIGENDKKNV